MILVLVIGVLVPLAVGRADETELKWPAAREAVRKYQSAMAKADKEFLVAARFATDTLQRDLSDAKAGAMKEGNLDEANLINEVLKRLDSRVTEKGISGIWKVNYGDAPRLYRFRLDGTVDVKPGSKTKVGAGKYRREGGRWVMDDTFSDKRIYFVEGKMFLEVLEGPRKGTSGIGEVIDSFD